MPASRRFFARIAELKAWEAANPELAKAWREANAEDHRRAQEHERAQAMRRLEDDAPFQLGKLGVPNRAAVALRLALATTTAMEGIHAHLAEPRPLVALLGGPGTGKTVAAAWLARRRLAEAVAREKASGGTHRDPLVWVSSVELAGLSTFTETDRAWFERMQAAELLVLDDFGVEDLHDHAKQRLERLMDVRYGNFRETVITSNCSKAEFAKRVGERIADRFSEAGRVIQCGNLSLRRKG